MRYVLPVVALLIAAALLTFGTLSQWRRPSPDPDDSSGVPTYTFAEMRAIARLSDELDEHWVRMHRFSDAYSAIRADLWRRKISASEAADRVLESAREVAPVYLRSLRTQSPELSDREAAVASILNYLVKELEFGTDVREASAEAWEEILCEVFASEGASPALMQALSMTAAPARP